MDGEQLKPNNERKIQVIFVTVLILVSIGAVVAYFFIIEPNLEQEKMGPKYTDYYTAMLPEDAYSEILQNDNFLVIDCRSCKCNYNGGHLPNATWSTSAIDFFNTTYNLLVYDNDGQSESIDFCEKLLNNTTNEIFILDGGYNAWVANGYEVIR